MLDLFADRLAIGAVPLDQPAAGTDNPDTLDGTAGADLISGLGGDDLIDGHAGDDSIDGGDGDDTIQGGLGHDTLLGGDGDDILMGANADDPLAGSGESIDGGAGIDYIAASHAADVLDGGTGDDQILADGADTIHAGDGADLIETAAGQAIGQAQIYGDTGDDLILVFGASARGDQGSTLDGGDGGDFIAYDSLGRGRAPVLLIGGAGDDALQSSSGGHDTLDGGAGVDIAIYNHQIHGVTCDLTAGTATGRGSGTDTLIGIEGFFGGAGADTAIGDDQANRLDGRNGADTLIGGGGGDALTGGGRSDLLNGGQGADYMSGDGGADTFVFESLADSTAAAPDTIARLKKHDVIDLSAIDADTTTAGDQAFVRVAAFDGHAGELTLTTSGVDTLLQLDVDGDGEADMTVALTGHVGGHSAFVL